MFDAADPIASRVGRHDDDRKPQRPRAAFGLFRRPESRRNALRYGGCLPLVRVRSRVDGVVVLACAGWRVFEFVPVTADVIRQTTKGARLLRAVGARPP